MCLPPNFTGLYVTTYRVIANNACSLSPAQWRALLIAFLSCKAVACVYRTSSTIHFLLEATTNSNFVLSLWAHASKGPERIHFVNMFLQSQFFTNNTYWPWISRHPSVLLERLPAGVNNLISESSKCSYVVLNNLIAQFHTYLKYTGSPWVRDTSL